MPRGNYITNTLRRIFGNDVHTPTSNRWAKGRSFDAAQTDRTNQAQWVNATGASINQTLETEAVAIRKRVQHESHNNEYLKGAMETHVVAMVGKTGPVAQVRLKKSKDSKKIKDEDIGTTQNQIEQVWREWTQRCDARGKQNLSGLLGVWVRSFWLYGEILVQKITVADKNNPKSISFRLLNLHPGRLASGFMPKQNTDTEVVMGVEVDKTGTPLMYYLNGHSSSNGVGYGESSRVPAQDMIHVFREDEPEQVRGVPWAACVLPQIAGLREFDKYVLEAAKNAAAMTLQWYTEHPDAKYINADSTLDIEIGMQSTGPPGWKMEQLKPEHPAANYMEYRKGILNGLGRGVNMPGMLVNLDSSGHNYSSARFDDQMFNKSNQHLQGWLEAQILNPVFYDVMAEAFLAGIIPVKPEDLIVSWIWPRPTHVDPLKEAKALTEWRKNGMSLAEVAAQMGLDWEEMVQQLKRELEYCKEKEPELIAVLFPEIAAAQKESGGNVKTTEEARASKIIDGVLAGLEDEGIYAPSN